MKSYTHPSVFISYWELSLKNSHPLHLLPMNPVPADSFCKCWQVTVAGFGLGVSQELVPWARSPTWVSGTQTFEPTAVASQSASYHEAGIGSRSWESNPGTWTCNMGIQSSAKLLCQLFTSVLLYFATPFFMLCLSSRQWCFLYHCSPMEINNSGTMREYMSPMCRDGEQFLPTSPSFSN